MHLLLPPSETKRSGGGSVFAPVTLAHEAALGETRIRVREALERLSRDEPSAVRALKLGTKNRDERLHNLQLETSGAMPALERYSGVLYDAIEVPSLPDSARDWISARVSVQSALFGLIGAGDLIPAYRLSASTTLPGLGTTLKRLWAEAHTGLDWDARGWILDLRSKDYAALAPLPDGAGARLHVAQRGPEGEVRALNHFNKAAKGDLVRRLALTRPAIDGAESFIEWAGGEGLEVVAAPEDSGITLITELGAPKLAAARARGVEALG